MPDIRSFLLALVVLSWSGLHAQDWDMYLSGTLSDATTGKPIPFAVVEVFDELDTGFTAISRANASGDWERELYTGHMANGGYYIVEFLAEGYQSRMALFDVAEVEKKNGENTAWRIRMDVALEPMTAGTLPAGDLLGYCAWQKSSRNLRWNDERTRKAYPVERYSEDRIAAHHTAIDSVYRLQGLMVDGVVKDQWSGVPLSDVLVQVSPAASKDSVFRTDRFGYYVMILPHDAVYRLEFGQDGLVHKRVDVDVTSIPEDVKTTGFRATVDIRLFADMPDEDLSFLEEPMGRMTYDPGTRNMAWDMAVSKPVMERLDAILQRHAPPANKGR